MASARRCPPNASTLGFLPKEQNDFFFYYGLGYGLEAQMQEAELPRSISIWKRRSSIAVLTMYDKERSIKMVYGDVKQNFPKGLLNEYWHCIELSRLYFSEGESEDSLRNVERIDQLKDSLIRYTIISPWPLPENAEPETFRVRFFAKEHEDFYYYLGFGQGIRASLQSDLPQED